MSDPLNDFSQPDADVQTPSDDRDTGLVGESDATGDQPAVDDMDDAGEDDDTGVSLRDVAEREQSADWS
jgi:hypothetical protein